MRVDLISDLACLPPAESYDIVSPLRTQKHCLNPEFLHLGTWQRLRGRIRMIKGIRYDYHGRGSPVLSRHHLGSDRGIGSQLSPCERTLAELLLGFVVVHHYDLALHLDGLVIVVAIFAS